MSRPRRLILLAGVLFSMLVGCGGPPGIDQYQAGRPSRYVAGRPTFDLETVPSVPGQPSGVVVYLSVPSTSITFEKRGQLFRALQELRVAVRVPEAEEYLLERAWVDTTTVLSYAATQRHEPFIIQRHLNLPPGEYDVEVTLENLSSGKDEMRYQRVDIPDSSNQSPFLGKILVEARTDRGTLLPVVSFAIPSGLDSLQCVSTLYNKNPARPSLMTVDLVRFRADSLPASPPMMLNSFDFPMGFAIMRLDEVDTLVLQTRPVVSADSREKFSLGIRGLPPGNYMVSFQVQTPLPDPATHDTLLHVERYISIGGPTFPRPSTLPEMIGSMGYIARRDEMKELLEAPTLEVARARFDSLWLSFRNDRKLAAELLNRYYSRVEEANRRFTNTKEGWRTDQGSLFIVLGPPVEVMESKDRQIWYYDLRGNDAVNVYTFQRRYVTIGTTTLITYHLYRQAYYEVFWNRMVDKWREGEVF